MMMKESLFQNFRCTYTIPVLFLVSFFALCDLAFLDLCTHLFNKFDYFFSPQDSYALCRVFRKTIQTPKTKEEKNVGDEERDAAWVSEEQLLGDNTCRIEISKGREAEGENFNNDYCKFPSETSSSDVTQGTPIETATADDLQAPIASDEANSSANIYPVGVDFSSNLIQVH